MDDYIDTFRRQFTEQEWDTIKDSVDDWEQLQSFYRYWVKHFCSVKGQVMYICCLTTIPSGFQASHLDCGNIHFLQCLKESYVKVLGTGLGFSVSRLDFHVNSGLSKGFITRDTQVYVDGKLEPDWTFEETLLDSTHCVVVAQQKVG